MAFIFPWCFSTLALYSFVFSVQDMRNARLKDVRSQWKHSRFFLGKNKVMAKALGKTEEEEYRPGLAGVARLLSGNVGLLFTNKDVETTTKWFADFAEGEFARAGNTAPLTVKLDAGPLPQFSHSIEPHLRKLGLPTSLQKGVVTLDKPFTVCTYFYFCFSLGTGVRRCSCVVHF